MSRLVGPKGPARTARTESHGPSRPVPRSRRFPVLLAIDEVQALFADSGITDPQGRKVPSWGLSGPRLFLDYISGRRAFVRMASVLAPRACVLIIALWPAPLVRLILSPPVPRCAPLSPRPPAPQARGTTLSAISLSDPLHPLTPELIQGAGLRSARRISPYDPLDATYVALARGVGREAAPAQGADVAKDGEGKKEQEKAEEQAEKPGLKVFKVTGKLAVLEAAAMVRAWREAEVLQRGCDLGAVGDAG